MGALGRPVTVAVPLVVVAGGYVLLPTGALRDGVFAGMGMLCVLVASAGLWRRPPRHRLGWVLVIAGFFGWVLGDALLSWQGAVGLDAYPGPSDATYVVAYVLMAAGVVVMGRDRPGRSEVAALLDAAIVTTGAAVVAGVFLLAPIAADSELTLLGKLTSAFYPMADILLLGVLVRHWAQPGLRTGASRLLLSAFGLVLAGDTYYLITTLVTGDVSSQLLNDLVWYAGYVLLATATWHQSAQQVSTSALAPAADPDPTRRMLVLAGGLLLPPLSLLGLGIEGDLSAWPVIAAGSLVLSLLVLARLSGLLGVIRGQSEQVAALARSDALTGVPNRRSWDFELARASRAAAEGGYLLSVALIDLDHFKAYNDTHGHPAGDRLLKEAAASWIQHLVGDEVLARVGGEEFGVLFPGRDGESARERLHLMLADTPSGQTFSAGVATWHPDTDPTVAVSTADEALYQAKRAGRNQVSVAPYVPADLLLPQPRIALQPIIDLAGGAVVGYEALSRFAGSGPMEVFEQARTLGRLAELEAAAIGSARMVAAPGALLSVNVDIASLATPEVRAALFGDLSGIVVEVTEHTHSPADPDRVAAVQNALQDYRDRGALIAVDDWGTGYSDMARLDLIEPEIVKLDMSIVHAVDSARNRALVSSVLAWAARRGAQVCAEGIETTEQLERLAGMGVHLGQGFVIGKPELAKAHVFG